MLAGLAYWGFAEHDGASAWVLGLGLPVATGVIWGAFVAPKARWPVRTSMRHVIELVLFGGAAAALIAADEPVLGAVLFVSAVLTSPIGGTAWPTTAD
jgi:hypothetical protein